MLSTTYIILHVCGGGRERGLKTGNVIPIMHKVNLCIGNVGIPGSLKLRGLTAVYKHVVC